MAARQYVQGTVEHRQPDQGLVELNGLQNLGVVVRVLAVVHLVKHLHRLLLCAQGGHDGEGLPRAGKGDSAPNPSKGEAAERKIDNVATATDAHWGGEGYGAAMLQYHRTSHKFLYSARVISSALALQKFLRAMMYFWFCISSR